ncbi:LOW QUALITY PROTEIN: uncharacterized protein C5orf34 homolog [Alca torda]
MAAERLMVLFGDGSVEVHYAGGSRLLLSPCGCEYLHRAALPAAAHPLQPAETSRQRVAFAVSAYRVGGGSAMSGPGGKPVLPWGLRGAPWCRVPGRHRRANEGTPRHPPELRTGRLRGDPAAQGNPAPSLPQRRRYLLLSEQLLRALDFRNKFCSRPYLPSRVIPPERKKVSSVISLEIRWPDPATAHLTRCIDNGSVKISLDGYAHLYLSELQQEFTVEFLCKVSQSSAASLGSSQMNSSYQAGDQHGKSSKNSIAETSSKQTRIESEKNEHGYSEGKYREPSNQDRKDRDVVPVFYTNCSSEYVWVTQRWSLPPYPEEWKYPLSLALMCYNLHTVKNVTKTSLPLSCRAPHLHRWTFCDLFQNQDTGNYPCSQLIQIVWCQGVFYRFTGQMELPQASLTIMVLVSLQITLLLVIMKISRFRNVVLVTYIIRMLQAAKLFIHGRANITEIYPGDDSFFKSEGAFFGNYFVHYAIQKGTKKREEKMYSVNSLPPDVPGNPYSISSIITPTKILQYCYKTKLSLTHNYYLCCWKMVPETDGREMLPVLLYEKVIPSVGRLIVYSDYKIHAAFWDGVTLNMVWDYSSSCSKIQVNEDVGWCKLTTPDVQQLIQISHPGIYERSADAELEKYRDLPFYWIIAMFWKGHLLPKPIHLALLSEKKKTGGQPEENG